jgi:DNA-binding transcriptional ArsR family regulator
MPSKKRATKGGTATTKGGKATTRKPRKKTGSRDLVDHALMKALSHRLRTRIFAILTERPASPNELTKELNEGLSQVSYHFGVLRKLGLTEIRDEVPRRGAVEHYHRAVRRILIPKDAWKGLPPGVQGSISEEIMRRSFEDADASMKAGIFDDPDSYASWSPLILDRPALKRVDVLAKEFLEALFDVQAEANGRLAEEGGEGFSVTVMLASFPSTRSPEESKRASVTKQR